MRPNENIRKGKTFKLNVPAFNKLVELKHKCQAEDNQFSTYSRFMDVICSYLLEEQRKDKRERFRQFRYNKHKYYNQAKSSAEVTA